VDGAVWVFDVDGCLIDSLTGSSVRPGTHQLLEDLREQGCEVLLWSAGGADYARERAEEHGFDHLVDAFHDKDGRDEAGRYTTTAFTEDLAGVVFVDDRPEDMPVGADIIAVFPYLVTNPHDRGLSAAVRRLEAQRS
jgi:phosphoglycolate phosphatase-like HAD superfamily hydrolase